MLFVALIVTVLCIYVLSTHVLYPCFFSPLGDIPAAHWSARYCRIWVLWKRYLNTQNATLLAAHREHGPVVLIAPKELSISCIDGGVRTVYNGGYEKSSIYPSLFTNYGALNTFTTVHRGPHSVRRRMISNVFSKSSILSSSLFSDSIHTVLLQRLLPGLGEKQSAAVEAHLMCKAITLDITSAFLFGSNSGTRFVNDDKSAKVWINLYELRNKHHFWPSQLGTLFTAVSSIGISLVPRSVKEATDYLEASCLHMCDSAEHGISLASQKDAHTSENESQTVYSQLRSCLLKSPVKGRCQQSLLDRRTRCSLASEMLDLLSAGHETSSIALSFLLHNLALRPDLQARLRDEQKTYGLAVSTPMRNEDSSIFPTAKQLNRLPLLHAIFLETLRLYPPIAGAQYRVTPDIPGGISLGKYSGIPGGVQVSSSAKCLHRNEGIFFNPSAWIPERWLPDPNLDRATDDTRLKYQHQWFWAFSSGGRSCIGRHLAAAQIKAITTALLASFKICHVKALENIGQYLQEDRYTAHPIDPELYLRFVPV